MTKTPPKRRLIPLLAGVVAGLAIFAGAANAATIDALHATSASGTVNYLFTAGNQVWTGSTGGVASDKAGYRYYVLASDGTVRQSHACFAGNVAQADSYTVLPSDTASGATGYRYVLEQFDASNNRATNVATCGSSAVGSGVLVGSKYFDVVTSAVDGGLTLLSPSQTAQVRFSGAVNRNPDTGVATAVATGATAPQWNVKWLNGAA